MPIAPRLLLLIVSLVTVFAPCAPSHASGAYSCCLIDKSGKQYTYRNRASSFYKGSIERLCRTIALEEGVRQCNPAVTDMAADLDFTKEPMPASYDLSKSCKKYPCTIGILIAGSEDMNDEKAHADLAVYNSGLQCSIDQQINSKVDGWVLQITAPKLANKPVKAGAGCVVVRVKGGKEMGRTSFEYGPISKQ